MHLLLVLVWAVVSGRSQTAHIPSVSFSSASTSTTPVPILRQVNSVNDDGSYTYGFEAADGTFKLETRSADGQVVGKYGYIDANGERQVFDYNADKAAGFNPTSNLIPQPVPEVAAAAQAAHNAAAAATANRRSSQIVEGVDIALEGYSEDRDQDGFVDPIPSHLASRRKTTNVAGQNTANFGTFTSNANAATPLHQQQTAAAPTFNPTVFTSSINRGQQAVQPQTTFQSFPLSATANGNNNNNNRNQNQNSALQQLLQQQQQRALLQQLQQNSQSQFRFQNGQPLFASSARSF